MVHVSISAINNIAYYNFSILF